MILFKNSEFGELKIKDPPIEEPYVIITELSWRSHL
jgi:hypothetical protein